MASARVVWSAICRVFTAAVSEVTSVMEKRHEDEEEEKENERKKMVKFCCSTFPKGIYKLSYELQNGIYIVTEYKLDNIINHLHNE